MTEQTGAESLDHTEELTLRAMIRFCVSGLHERIRHVGESLQHISAALQSRLYGREPDDRPVMDGDGREMDLKEAMVIFARAVEMMAKIKHTGPGSINGNGKSWLWPIVIAGIFTTQGVLFVMLSGIEKHLAVIDCRMSSDCKPVVLSGR